MRLTRHRRFTANHTWHLDWRGQALFVKANPNRHEACAEITGHARLQGHYHTPALRAARRVPGWTLLFYDRWPHLGTDRGLLLDAIAHADRIGRHGELDCCLNDLIGHYRRVIAATARLATPSRTVQKLYADRARPGGRLEAYYRHDRPWQFPGIEGGLRPSDLADRTLIVNGQPYRIDIATLTRALRDHFTSDAPVWAAITQGDPTDWNLGWSRERGPVWFDYDTAGHNALAGEFACFLLYQHLHGAWLTPRYNRTAFTDHPAILHPRCLTRPQLSVDTNRTSISITGHYRPTPARRHTIARYLDELVHPIAAGLGIDDVTAWLRPYLAMRLLAVYNLTDLDAPDVALTLSLLARTLDTATPIKDLFTLETTDQKAH